jgi:DNA (cytosine-5)-methyltransferase 1
VKKASKDRKLTSLSFFSGCLGLDLGLEKAGLHTVLTSEIDKYSVASIKANRPNVPVLGDISKLTHQEIRLAAGLGKHENPTVIVGGPPCQAFSTAGKRESFNDPRGNVFLIENVRGLLSASLKHKPISERTNSNLEPDELPGSALNHVLELLRSYGYSYSFNLYNSANFGVPQIRERVILIASREHKNIPYLTPTHSNNPDYGLPEWATFRDAVKGLREPSMHGISFPADRLKYYKMLKAGQNWRDLPTEKIKKEAMGGSYFSGGGKTGFYRRLDPSQPSPTLVTHPAMPATDLCHPTKDRPLTVEEYKRIQQFPDDWIISGNLISQYRQLGNAVPVGLGEAVGKHLMDLLHQRVPKISYPEFEYSRYKNTSHTEWQKAYDLSLSKLKIDQLKLFDA